MRGGVVARLAAAFSCPKDPFSGILLCTLFLPSSLQLPCLGACLALAVIPEAFTVGPVADETWFLAVFAPG